jgi:glucose/arabinose dehydrogenase
MTHTLVTALVFALAAAASVQAQIRSELVASGFSAPVAFVQDPSDRTVQVVLEQAGHVRVLKNGVVQALDFLDLSGVVVSSGEMGLLGLAFAPDYVTSRRFFVYFIVHPNGDLTQQATVVARFLRSLADPLRADPDSRFDLMWPGGQRFISQPYTNHKGGNIAFGPDGYLYIGLGDGGSGGDPAHLAQDPTSLLGKMLRLNVSVADADAGGYDIPGTNPFVGQPGVLPEIWAFGLRNPWRWSFDDPAHGGTGALVIADVGQNLWEEINYEPAGAGGRNYGWRLREGRHNYDISRPAFFTPLTEPIYEYPHSVGHSITGGFVYRGAALGPAFTGRYFFADVINNKVWSLGLSIGAGAGEATATDVIDHTADVGAAAAVVSSFGVDADGEIYLVSYSAGLVYRLAGVITWANPAPVAAGTALGGTQLNATASVPGTFVYSPAAGTALTAGTQTLSVTFTPADTTSNTVATRTVTIVVTASGGGFVGPGNGGPATGSVSGTTLTYNGATYVIANGKVTFPDCTLYIAMDSGLLIPAGMAPGCTPGGGGGLTPVITWTNPASMAAGTALGGTRLNATANVPGTFVYTPAAGTVLTAGTQTLSVMFTPADTANYTVATRTVTIVVTASGGGFVGPGNGGPATGSVSGTTLTYSGATYPMVNGRVTFPDCTLYIAMDSGLLIPAGMTPGCTPGGGGGLTPVITWTNPASMAAGTALGGTRLNATANVPGTFVYTPAAGTVLTAGTQTLSVMFTPADTANYTVATRTVTIVVTASGGGFVGPGNGGPATGSVSGTTLTYSGATYPMVNGRVTFPDCTLYIAMDSGLLIPAGMVPGCTSGGGGSTFVGPGNGGPATGSVSGTTLTYNGATYPMVNGRVTFPDCTLYIAMDSGLLIPAGMAPGCTPGGRNSQTTDAPAGVFDAGTGLFH